MLTADQVAELRPLLCRARAAGYRQKHTRLTGEIQWTRQADGRDQTLSLYNGYLTIDPDRSPSTRSWVVPAERADHVVAALELAGALPPVDHTELIRRAIADPGQFTPRTFAPDCTYVNCTCESVPAWSARAVVIALAGAR